MNWLNQHGLDIISVLAIVMTLVAVILYGAHQ